MCCGLKNTDCCDEGKGAFLDSSGRVIKDDPDPTTTSKATTSKATTKTSKESDADPTGDATDGDEEDPEKSSSSTENTRSQVTVTQTAAITNDDGQLEIVETKETAFTGSAVAASPDASDFIPAPEAEGGLSGGAAAGIGAGVGALAMLLLGGAFVLWRRKQKKKKLQQYYTAGGLPLPAYRAGHQPTDSEDGAYVGGFKPTTADGVYSGKLAAESNPPTNPSAELPHHYPQQYAHELPPHATGNAVHEMQGEYPVAHEMGVGSPRR